MSDNFPSEQKHSRTLYRPNIFDRVYLGKCANLTAILRSILQQGRRMKKLDSVTPFARIVRETSLKIKCTEPR